MHTSNQPTRILGHVTEGGEQVDSELAVPYFGTILVAWRKRRIFASSPVLEQIEGRTLAGARFRGEKAVFFFV